MGFFKTVDGDLINLALEGNFDVIVHGCNCFCTQGAGIAKGMAKTFLTNKFPSEIITQFGFDVEGKETSWDTGNRGDIRKLGNIEYQTKVLAQMEEGDLIAMPLNNVFEVTSPQLIVVNAYTQYNYGKNHADGDAAPVDYAAIILCMRKINHTFKGKHIGLPKIGSGLAGGSWILIERIIKDELKDCDVTIVNYVP